MTFLQQGRRTNVADTGAKALLHGQDLVYDLVRPQVARKAALACRAERAPHWAADLCSPPVVSLMHP